MSERIKQLAEQAGLLGPGSRVGNAHEATEKFAELIVRECIKQARKDENGLAYEAVGRIAKYFGIK